MSVFSQFGIYGYAPVGAYVQALDAPVNFTSGAAEYLRVGTVKTYSAAYTTAIAAAPQLRVFGTDATTYGSVTSTGLVTYYYIGSVYVAIPLTGPWKQGALNVLGTNVTSSNSVAAGIRAAVNGTSYLVCPRSTAAAHYYTADGITVTAVGGTWAGTEPIPGAICFGNNSWITLSSLAATANEQTYINNASPAGAWTLGASTNLGMTACKGIAYGAGLFVAVGTSGSATAGKIATTASVGSAWTDRTSASGITFGASDSISDIVFDGTGFVAITSTGNIITSTDGTAWTLVGQPMDLSSLAPLSGAASWTAGGNTTHTVSLSTDGAGTVVYQPTCSSATIRPVFAISTDHGATWKSAQTYIGKTGIGTGGRSMSYANGRWISNVACYYLSCVDIGTSLTTPNYIGNQTSVAAGQFVRIK